MASSSSNKTVTSMLCYAVITAFIASFVLSVDAIICHQCNSHLDEDCIALRLNTPRAPRDDQYLKECEGENSINAFCRKTVITVEVTGEHRIVRSCGWHTEDIKDRQNICFESDNEGFKEQICACFEDGCNAAPSAMRGNALLYVALVGASIWLATVFKRSG